jgi:hypothetical protein
VGTDEIIFHHAEWVNFQFPASIEGKGISFAKRLRLQSSRIPDFPRHVVSGYINHLIGRRLNARGFFFGIMNQRVKMDRLRAAVTIGMRQISGKPPPFSAR